MSCRNTSYATKLEVFDNKKAFETSNSNLVPKASLNKSIVLIDTLQSGLY